MKNQNIISSDSSSIFGVITLTTRAYGSLNGRTEALSTTTYLLSDGTFATKKLRKPGRTLPVLEIVHICPLGPKSALSAMHEVGWLTSQSIWASCIALLMTKEETRVVRPGVFEVGIGGDKVTIDMPAHFVDGFGESSIEADYHWHELKRWLFRLKSQKKQLKHKAAYMDLALIPQVLFVSSLREEERIAKSLIK